MNWPAVGMFAFQGSLLGLLAGMSSWQVHPASGWKQHVAMAMVSCLTYMIGKLQISPLPNGIALPKEIKPALVLALPLLSGCAGVFGLAGNAEQLHELARVKDAACVTVTTVYGKTTAVNVDKGIPQGGGTVKIGADCTTEISAEPRGK
jgi:hypothetical protein